MTVPGPKSPLNSGRPHMSGCTPITVRIDALLDELLCRNLFRRAIVAMGYALLGIVSRSSLSLALTLTDANCLLPNGTLEVPVNRVIVPTQPLSSGVRFFAPALFCKCSAFGLDPPFWHRASMKKDEPKTSEPRPAGTSLRSKGRSDNAIRFCISLMCLDRLPVTGPGGLGERDRIQKCGQFVGMGWASLVLPADRHDRRSTSPTKH